MSEVPFTPEEADRYRRLVTGALNDILTELDNLARMFEYEPRDDIEKNRNDAARYAYQTAADIVRRAIPVNRSG